MQLKVLSTNESPPTREVVRPTQKIKVGLVQLGNSFSGQCYLPLSAGMLQAYAQKHLTYVENYEFLMPLYTFLPVPEAADRLTDADIVGFSVYVWNFENSLAIARELKQRKPETVIVFGGPQVPDSYKQFRRTRTVNLNPDELQRKRIHFTEDFHRVHPFIDIACHGEGERAFKMILEQMVIDSCQDKSQIRSASYLDGNGDFHFNPKLMRMNNQELANASSPFTTGVFDKLMTTFSSQQWIQMYETDRGCPYPCSYCDWGGATEDKISKFSMEQIYADIMWTGEHQIPYVFLCNANFGILERDVQIAEFFAESKAKYGYPEGVSTQNAKNPKKHTIQALKVLEKAGLNRATVMSQQSLNQDTLKAVRRENMQLEEYYAIQKQLAAEGVYTMTDMILPMPEETYHSLLEGISTLITNGQYNRIQFNNLSILLNTEMGNPEYQEEYGMEIIRAKIINYHGKKNASISGVEEYQQLVVATNTMPREEWVKARSFCHLVSLIFFDKLLQIPIITLHEVYQIPYRQIWERVMEKVRQPQEFPIFSEIFDFFEKHSRDMQNRLQEEMMHSPEWLDIWWYPDEYIFIQLCRENKLGVFFQEAKRLLVSCLESSQSTDILFDTIKLNQMLIKLPFQTTDLELTLSYNIWEFYRAVILGKTVPIVAGHYRYTIDRTTESWNSWNEWYEKMVWYSNRRGAYLYGNKNPHQEIAGHY